MTLGVLEILGGLARDGLGFAAFRGFGVAETADGLGVDRPPAEFPERAFPAREGVGDSDVTDLPQRPPRDGPAQPEHGVGREPGVDAVAADAVIPADHDLSDRRHDRAGPSPLASGPVAARRLEPHFFSAWSIRA